MENGYSGLKRNQFSICNQFIQNLNPAISIQFQELWRNLLESHTGNDSDKLSDIIIILQQNLPNNFDEFIGHIAFVTLIMLAEIRLPNVKMNLCSRFCLGLDMDDWSMDVIKVSIIAKTISTVAHHDNLNILHIISILQTKNAFLLLVSLFLVWSVFENIKNDNEQVNDETAYIQSPSKLFEIMKKIENINEIKERFEQMEIFLQSLSTYFSIMTNKMLKKYETITKDFDESFLNDILGKINNWIKYCQPHIMNNVNGGIAMRVVTLLQVIVGRQVKQALGGFQNTSEHSF